MTKWGERHRQRIQDERTAAIVKLTAVASDPRRQAMMDIVEHVLRAAGYTEGRNAPDGSCAQQGFMAKNVMGGISVAPTYRRYDTGTTRRTNNLYRQALMLAFQRVLGSRGALRCINTPTDYVCSVLVTCPNDEQLKRLHAALAHN